MGIRGRLDSNIDSKSSNNTYLNIIKILFLFLFFLFNDFESMLLQNLKRGRITCYNRLKNCVKVRVNTKTGYNWFFKILTLFQMSYLKGVTHSKGSISVVSIFEFFSAQNDRDTKSPIFDVCFSIRFHATLTSQK